MAARNAMTERATVQRATTVIDSLGQPTPTWAAHLPSLPCRWWTKDENEVMDGQKVAVFSPTRILVPIGTDILVTDRITAIKNRAGVTLVGNTLQIRAVIRRRGHKEVRLMEVS